MASSGRERTRTLTVEADGCDLPVRIVWPAGKPGPAVVVLHEKRGIDEHTNGIAEQLAGEGYTVILPDLLARIGGSSARTPTLPSGARGLPSDWLIEDLLVTVDAMLEVVNVDRFALIGYSFGGVLAWELAGRDPRCKVLIDYHGRPPADLQGDLSDVTVMVIFAEADDKDKIKGTKHVLEGARRHHIEVFEGQRRGFEDPSRSDRFDGAAAERAWRLTLGWLRGHLAGEPTA